MLGIAERIVGLEVRGELLVVFIQKNSLVQLLADFVVELEKISK